MQPPNPTRYLPRAISARVVADLVDCATAADDATSPRLASRTAAARTAVAGMISPYAMLFVASSAHPTWKGPYGKGRTAIVRPQDRFGNLALRRRYLSRPSAFIAACTAGRSAT